jgi:hypothetical protein
MADPTEPEAPALRLVVRLTAVAVTLTFTAVDVTTVPLVSVTFAVNAVTPDAVGVQLTVYGDVSAVPMTVVPARKSTRLTVAPLPAAAVAVSVLLVPSAMTAPLDGADRLTVGTELATVTATADDVTAAPLESVTRAVIE